MATNPFMPPTAQAAAAAATVRRRGGTPERAAAGGLWALQPLDGMRRMQMIVCNAGWAPARPPPGRSCTASPLQAKKVDYMELPQPVRYEELQREVMSECGARPDPRRRQWRPAAVQWAAADWCCVCITRDIRSPHFTLHGQQLQTDCLARLCAEGALRLQQRLVIAAAPRCRHRSSQCPSSPTCLRACASI